MSNELKKELDRNRKAEIAKAAKEAGLININIFIRESDYEKVMSFNVPKDSFIEKKSAGRKTKNKEVGKKNGSK